MSAGAPNPLTVAEAAAELGVRPETVRQAIRAERLPAQRQPGVGQPYLIDRTDLAAYCDRMDGRSTADAEHRLAQARQAIIALLAERPRTRATLRARLSGAARGRALSTALQALIDDGVVADPGRGQSLRLSLTAADYAEMADSDETDPPRADERVGEPVIAPRMS